MARREKMSAVDTAWLRMDRPGNLMMICAVLSFRERVSSAALRRVLEERFLRFRRFRQRPVQTATGASWETPSDFDLDHHLIDVALPGKAGKRELQALVSRLARTPLNPAWPLCQVHRLERYDRGRPRTVRVHYCSADGIALVQVLLSMTDLGPHGPPVAAPPAAKKRQASDEASNDFAPPFADTMTAALKVGATLIERGADLWQHPAKAV